MIFSVVVPGGGMRGPHSVRESELVVCCRIVAVVHCTRRIIVLTGDSGLLNQFILALTQ